jgi:hypothetical protein
MDTLFSTNEASAILGVKYYKIVYAHMTGKVKTPEKVLGRRAYRWSDLSALAEHFKIQLIEPIRESAKEAK